MTFKNGVGMGRARVKRKRVFGWTYEDLSHLTGMEEDAIRRRVSRGLELDNIDVFMKFIKKNRKEK